MTKKKHLLSIIAIKWVLGWYFLEYEDRYRVQTDVCSHFVASMLDIGIPKPLILCLVKEIFPKKYLNGLREVIANTTYGGGILTVSNLRRFIEEDAIILWLPFLSAFHLQLQDEHFQRVTRACHFLFRIYNVVQFYDIDWYMKFRNLVFSPPSFAPLDDVDVVYNAPVD